MSRPGDYYNNCFFKNCIFSIAFKMLSFFPDFSCSFHKIFRHAPKHIGTCLKITYNKSDSKKYDPHSISVIFASLNCLRLNGPNKVGRYSSFLHGSSSTVIVTFPPPRRNSIDVYTSVGYMLRIDCWEAEKNLKTTPGSDCALNALAIDEPLEYAKLYLDGNLQMWVDAEDSLDIF